MIWRRPRNQVVNPNPRCNQDLVGVVTWAQSVHSAAPVALAPVAMTLYKGDPLLNFDQPRKVILYDPREGDSYKEPWCDKQDLAIELATQSKYLRRCRVVAHQQDDRQFAGRLDGGAIDDVDYREVMCCPTGAYLQIFVSSTAPIAQGVRLPPGAERSKRDAIVFVTDRQSTTSGTHFDESHSLLAVLTGAKRIMYAPRGELEPTNATAATSAFDPHLLREGSFGNWACMDLFAGEACIIPKHWWHNIISAGPFTVGISIDLAGNAEPPRKVGAPPAAAAGKRERRAVDLFGAKKFTSPREATAKAAFAVGTRVEARWAGGKEWYLGKISAVGEGGYDISYDDGDRENDVADALIRAAPTRQPPPPPPPVPAAQPRPTPPATSDPPDGQAAAQILECRICRNSIQRSDCVHSKCCNGSYCVSCYENWSKKKTRYTCPFCNTRGRHPVDHEEEPTAGRPRRARPTEPFRCADCNDTSSLLGIHKDDQSSTIPTLRCYDCYERWAKSRPEGKTAALQARRMVSEPDWKNGVCKVDTLTSMSYDNSITADNIIVRPRGSSGGYKRNRAAAFDALEATRKKKNG